MNALITLEIRRENLLKELNSLGPVKPQFMCNDTDDYQEMLELKWYKDKLRAEIENLNKSITILQHGPMIDKEGDVITIVCPNTRTKREILKVFKTLNMQFSISLKDKAIVCDSSSFDSFKEYMS